MIHKGQGPIYTQARVANKDPRNFDLIQCSLSFPTKRYIALPHQRGQRVIHEICPTVSRFITVAVLVASRLQYFNLYHNTFKYLC